MRQEQERRVSPFSSEKIKNGFTREKKVPLKLPIKREMGINIIYSDEVQRMKVYVITSGCYSDYHINRVFIDRDKAELYCAMVNKDFNHEAVEIEEYETSDDDIEGKLDKHYMFRITDGQEEPTECECIYRLSPKNKNQVYIDYRRIKAIVFLTRNDPELAFKIAQDMIAKYKAELNGL